MLIFQMLLFELKKFAIFILARYSITIPNDTDQTYFLIILNRCSLCFLDFSWGLGREGEGERCLSLRQREGKVAESGGVGVGMAVKDNCVGVASAIVAHLP